MGVFIALIIIVCWAVNLGFLLQTPEINFRHPLMYVQILLQTYLYTGLFITGHDAMHGSVASGRGVNRFFGFLTIFLYAGMWYPKLIENHKLHHQFPGTSNDPDFAGRSPNFWLWYLRFMYKYLTVIQLVIMAVIFNVLKLWFPVENIIVFWVVPAVLSTIQLFYFGTYQPHRKPHDASMEPHNARTLKKNHLWAMLSCYFFGYHHEHHEYPSTPWWKLYRYKA